jgi:hypothetical protein
MLKSHSRAYSAVSTNPEVVELRVGQRLLRWQNAEDGTSIPVYTPG